MPGKAFTKEKFANRLSDLMKDAGDTIYSLGEYLHLSPSAISKYTNANMIPKQVMVEAMATKYKVNPIWLMGADVEKYSESKPKYKEIPILGSIAAGQPILANERIEGYESVSENSKATFCLRVKGDSMINARIYDGDIVFIREQPEVETGEIAAVIIDGENATLKRFYKMGNQIILKPENPMHKEQIYNKTEFKQIKVLGKCIAVKFNLE